MKEFCKSTIDICIGILIGLLVPGWIKGEDPNIIIKESQKIVVIDSTKIYLKDIQRKINIIYPDFIKAEENIISLTEEKNEE